jgi:hypothetical protein
MAPPDQEIDRRRPVWDALSSFFLDTEFDDEEHRYIAKAIVASAYSPSEIQAILWDEVYPLVESNLRHPAGVWEGFDLDWMQQQIISGSHRRTVPMRIAAVLPYSPARMVRKRWQELLPFLPEHFRT